MFSDPQFWVAIAFFLFILAIFNPVRKILLKSLDQKILEIKNKIGFYSCGCLDIICLDMHSFWNF